MRPTRCFDVSAFSCPRAAKIADTIDQRRITAMPTSQQKITLDSANAGIDKISAANALARLHRYATADSGELHIAVADDTGFYRADAVRPESVCEVWVMSGRQPITYHGMESTNAYASACAMILGLKVAKAFGGGAAGVGMAGRPWLDELSL